RSAGISIYVQPVFSPWLSNLFIIVANCTIVVINLSIARIIHKKIHDWHNLILKENMELVAGYPFWLIKEGLLYSYPKLLKNKKCDAIIIGGGISGALT